MFEGADLFNEYICSVCGGRIVTHNREAGVTPFMLTCVVTKECEGPMLSSMYEIDQPPKEPANYEFITPTIDQLNALADELSVGETKQGRHDLYTALYEHKRRGGLFLLDPRQGKLVE